MEFITDIWDLIILQPMINSLVLLYGVFFQNFGIAIVIFTIIVRLILLPLTIRQSRQMKAMAAIQPKIKELQARYAKDRQRMSQETLRLYKEQGINPIGCLGPFFIQFPIWIGLWQAIFQTLPSTPERLVSLSTHLYSWLPRVSQQIPLDSSFLWMDLGLPDRTPVMPILVGVSTWLSQKMTMMPAMDPRTESTNRMMLWMMPLMFGFFATTFPSGLSLYWIVSNVIGMVIQGFITGWGPLTTMLSFRRSPKPAETAALVPPPEETATHADSRNDSQDGRRSYRDRPKGARRRARGGRGRRR